MEGPKSKHVFSLILCLCFYLFCVSPFGFIIDYFWLVYCPLCNQSPSLNLDISLVPLSVKIWNWWLTLESKLSFFSLCHDQPPRHYRQKLEFIQLLSLHFLYLDRNQVIISPLKFLQSISIHLQSIFFSTVAFLILIAAK